MLFNFFNKDKPKPIKKVEENISEKPIRKETPWGAPIYDDDETVYVNKNIPESDISFEFLKNFCVESKKYLEYCDNAVNYIKTCVLDIQNLNQNDGAIAQKLLDKFERNIDNTTIDYWKENINNISNTGKVKDKEILRFIKNIPTEEEKEKEFKRMICNDLNQYSYSKSNSHYLGSILILLEEFRNIHRFINDDSEKIKDIEEKSKRMIDEFLEKSRIIGINFDYVPLFENYMQYASNTKLIDNDIDDVYKDIKNLNKDDITQIFYYGYDEDFSYRNENTLVSLKE